MKLPCADLFQLVALTGGLGGCVVSDAGDPLSGQPSLAVLGIGLRLLARVARSSS